MHYLKNKDLIPILLKWQEEVKLAENEGKEKPEMPRVLCEAIILLARKITNRGNFRQYTWRDIMESSIIETLWKRTENFDINQSENLYGYWSRIAWNCCVAEINREKIELKKKAMIMSEMNIEDLINDDTVDPASISEFADYVRTFSKSDYLIEEQPKVEKNKNKKLPKNKFDDIIERI